MVGIMVDLHLAETAHNMRLIGQDTAKLSYAEVCSAIFAKHSTRKSEFDSSLSAYALRPLEMSAIYDLVMERLSELEAEAAAAH